jgi:hypothetical protein
LDFVQWPKRELSEAWRYGLGLQHAAKQLAHLSWQALTFAGNQPEPIERIQLQATFSNLGLNIHHSRGSLLKIEVSSKG